MINIPKHPSNYQQSLARLQHMVVHDSKGVALLQHAAGRRRKVRKAMKGIAGS